MWLRLGTSTRKGGCRRWSARDGTAGLVDIPRGMGAPRPASAHEMKDREGGRRDFPL